MAQMNYNAQVVAQNTSDAHLRFRGALLGLACGDAVGTAVEFMQRGTFPSVTDTIAAICGQVAGAFYGEYDIPQEWRRKIVIHDYICHLADGLRQLEFACRTTKSLSDVMSRA